MIHSDCRTLMDFINWHAWACLNTLKWHERDEMWHDPFWLQWCVMDFISWRWKVMVSPGKCKIAFVYRFCWTNLEADWCQDEWICTGSPGRARMLLTIPAPKKLLITEAHISKMLLLKLCLRPWLWTIKVTNYNLEWRLKTMHPTWFPNLKSKQFCLYTIFC